MDDDYGYEFGEYGWGFDWHTMPPDEDDDEYEEYEAAA